MATWMQHLPQEEGEAKKCVCVGGVVVMMMMMLRGERWNSRSEERGEEDGWREESNEGRGRGGRR